MGRLVALELGEFEVPAAFRLVLDARQLAAPRAVEELPFRAVEVGGGRLRVAQAAIQRRGDHGRHGREHFAAESCLKQTFQLRELLAW
jgi:hypothetical protein